MARASAQEVPVLEPAGLLLAQMAEELLQARVQDLAPEQLLLQPSQRRLRAQKGSSPMVRERPFLVSRSVAVFLFLCQT